MRRSIGTIVNIVALRPSGRRLTKDTSSNTKKNNSNTVKRYELYFIGLTVLVYNIVSSNRVLHGTPDCTLNGTLLNLQAVTYVTTWHSN